MDFIVAIGIILAVTVVPVMIGARMVGARNQGFGSALLAVIILGAMSVAILRYVPNHSAAFAASAASDTFFLAGILGTTLWRGLIVSVISVAIQYAVTLAVLAKVYLHYA